MDDLVPRGIDGRPLARVSMGVSEKIGLPAYSNVEISGWVTRYCEDTPDVVERTLTECVQAVEERLGVERQAVIDMAKAK